MFPHCMIQTPGFLESIAQHPTLGGGGHPREPKASYEGTRRVLGEKGKNGFSLVLTNRGWGGPRRICKGGRGREAVKQKNISSPIILKKSKSLKIFLQVFKY